MGPGSLPWLERALDDNLAAVRARACRNIGALGKEAVHLLPALAVLIEDPDEVVRLEAARAFIQVAPEHDPGIPRAQAVLRELEGQ